MAQCLLTWQCGETMGIYSQNVEVQQQHRQKQAPMVRVLYGQAVKPRLLESSSAQSCRSDALCPGPRLVECRYECHALVLDHVD